METKIIPYELYCCASIQKFGNLMFGGWSFILLHDSKIIAESYGSEIGSQPRMELLAIINGIEEAQKFKQKKDEIRVYTNSGYVMNCYTKEWYKTWLKNGWKTSTDESVINYDLWIKLIPYFDRLDYNFSRVVPLGDITLDDKAKRYAKRAAKKLKENWKGYGQ